MTATVLWLLLAVFRAAFRPMDAGVADLRRRRHIRSRHRPHLELRRDREDRRGALGTHRQLFADLCVHLRGHFSRRSLGFAEYRRDAAGHQRRGGTVDRSKPATGEWRKLDVDLSSRSAPWRSERQRFCAKQDWITSPIPVLAGAVTAGTAAIFSFALLQFQGGKEAFKLTRQSAAWLFPAAFFNTAATLSVFYALSHGKVVIVEPLVSSNPVLTLLFTAIFLRDLEAVNLRVISGALLTVVGNDSRRVGEIAVAEFVSIFNGDMSGPNNLSGRNSVMSKAMQTRTENVE